MVQRKLVENERLAMKVHVSSASTQSFLSSGRGGGPSPKVDPRLRVGLRVEWDIPVGLRHHSSRVLTVKAPSTLRTPQGSSSLVCHMPTLCLLLCSKTYPEMTTFNPRTRRSKGPSVSNSHSFSDMVEGGDVHTSYTPSVRSEFSEIGFHPSKRHKWDHPFWNEPKFNSIIDCLSNSGPEALRS
jgi:hypothetical protein